MVHATYDYPGVPVVPGSVKRRHDVLDGIRIPLRPHFGVIAVAPREADFVDSIPPSYFGGNLDNWRLGKGSTVYLPVSVPGALLSVGDPHAAQGDGELGGTAIECSMTGTFQVILHKKADLAGRPFRRSDLSADRDRDRLGADRIQPPELSRRIRRQGPERGLRDLVARSRDEGRVPQRCAAS